MHARAQAGRQEPDISDDEQNIFHKIKLRLEAWEAPFPYCALANNQKHYNPDEALESKF
jgi:hypothetical protein